MTGQGLERLQRLFAQEAEQRLARLGQLVLELEQRDIGDVGEVIAEIFREVHTLKGSAAVVGLEDVAGYAHHLEDKLGRLRSGAIAPTPTIVDALLVTVDRLGSLIAESLGDGDIETTVSAAALDVLDAAFVLPAPAAVGDGPGEVVPSQVAADGLPTASRAGAAGGAGPGTVMVPVERLDGLVRMVGEAAAAHLRVGQLLTDRTGVDPGEVVEFSELSRLLNGLQEAAMHTRMVPVSTITDSLQRAVRDASRTLGKDVRWEVRGEDTELDRGVLGQLAGSLLHLVRNAVDHGVEATAERAAAGKSAQAVVRLHAMQLGSEVIVAVSDDGGGVDLARVRAKAVSLGLAVDELSVDDTLQLIFRSGFTTATFVSDLSGRGVGLDVVRAGVEAAGGRVEVRSAPGAGAEFRVIVPITLAVMRCLLVESGGQRFALALQRIALVRAESTSLRADGRCMIEVDGVLVHVSDLADVLGLPSTRTGWGTYVVVNGTIGRSAFIIDALVGQRDVALTPLNALIPRVDVIAGTSIEPDGSILLVLDATGLVERSRRREPSRSLAPVPATGATARRGRLLVVDDALTVRELQRSILERAGFDVTLAADGVEALACLAAGSFDLVLTDVEMPRMDGFELTERIRAHPTMGNVGVLVLTSLASDSDRRRGMDAGADGYLVKSDFDEQGLLAAVDRLVGVPA